MYLHTLDDEPASFADSHGGYIHFVGGRHRATLVRSLRQLRREQSIAQATAAASPFAAEWANPKRYGYVLVEVPVNG